MVTSENLSQVLMALRDASVRRCKLGDFEVEFEPDMTFADKQCEPPLQLVHTPTPIAPQTSQPTRRDGYSALFSGRAPGFTPADE